MQTSRTDLFDSLEDRTHLNGARASMPAAEVRSAAAPKSLKGTLKGTVDLLGTATNPQGHVEARYSLDLSGHVKTLRAVQLIAADIESNETIEKGKAVWQISQGISDLSDSNGDNFTSCTAARPSLLAAPAISRRPIQSTATSPEEPVNSPARLAPPVEPAFRR